MLSAQDNTQKNAGYWHISKTVSQKIEKPMQVNSQQRLSPSLCSTAKDVASFFARNAEF